ncbi:MAG: galactose mutarotase [Muribaculaceae bacterium]|nr:galactose mutarotase [Muribaculaceae bacterium]
MNEKVEFFKLISCDGSYLQLCNYGARMTALVVVDSSGTMRDILVGYSELSDYIGDDCYFGATVGTFANRIQKASFSLDGIEYKLDKNDGTNCNHGGFEGYSNRFWYGEYVGDKVEFTLNVAHLDSGFPGNMEVKVIYGFDNNNCVTIEYEARSDRKAILNLTNHSYFNLSGVGNIFNHRLKVYSDTVLDTDKYFIPTGEFRNVADTEFDFRESRLISSYLGRDTEQLRWNRGYNHCFVLSNVVTGKMHHAATLNDDFCGLQLDIFTTYPGVLIYSAGCLSSSRTGKFNNRISESSGICFEAQYFPDTPNKINFPQCEISPEKPYKHIIKFMISKT